MSDGLEKLTVPELRDELKKEGVTGVSKDTKPTLLAKLRDTIKAKQPYKQERMVKKMPLGREHRRRQSKGTWRATYRSHGRMR